MKRIYLIFLVLYITFNLAQCSYKSNKRLAEIKEKLLIRINNIKGDGIIVYPARGIPWEEDIDSKDFKRIPVLSSVPALEWELDPRLEQLKKNHLVQLYHKLEPINELDNNKINSLETNNLNRSKRSITNLPSDAHKIIIHNMRNFDVYGSSNGAYIVIHGNNNAQKIPGVEGKVIHGIITDAYYQQKYNIYLTVKNDNCIYQYYALKDGETTAHKINGLPDDAKLLSIHNLASVIFFGSSNGAYELIQGQLNASKIPNVNGNVVKIKLNGSSRKYDAEFITVEDTFNKCKYDLDYKKLEDKLNMYENEMKHFQEQIEKNLIKITELEKFVKKCNSSDLDQVIPNIE